MKNIIFKKVLPFSVILLFLLQIFYISNEPNITQALTATDGVTVTLVVDPGLTITTPADVAMSPNISMSSNGSIGSAAWTVKTNAPGGYTLNVKASASPALVSGGNSFADYSEGTVGTPEAWNVTNAKEFGYTVHGNDVTGGTSYWGTGASCGSGGVPTGTMKYVGFKTTDKAIATSATVTPVAGTTTTICLAAEQSEVFAQSGTYTATITATAVTS